MMEYGEDGEDEEDGAELCLCCLSPVAPAANFCGDCGAPLGFFAGTIPYQRILAEGFLFRRAIQSPKSMLTVIGIWLIFGTYALLGYVSLHGFMDRWSLASTLEDLAYAVMQAIMVWYLLIGLAGVLMVTRNYLVHIKASSQASGCSGRSL